MFETKINAAGESVYRITAGTPPRDSGDDDSLWHSAGEYIAQAEETQQLLANQATGFTEKMTEQIYAKANRTAPAPRAVAPRRPTTLEGIADRAYGTSPLEPSARGPIQAPAGGSMVPDLVVAELDADTIFARYNAKAAAHAQRPRDGAE